MAYIGSDEAGGPMAAVRQQARMLGYIRRAQVMLIAAGITAFGIVAVAAAMLTTLL